jgi:2-polyprenyl-6-methoxyphenol hydroxylase-like FAD-dependent oxidoreductase
MSVEQFDGVVVAGAGPVGLFAALGLARAGVPVLVVEALEAIPRSPRAIVYHPPTLRVLDRLGVLADGLQVGVCKYDYQFRDRAGTVLARMNIRVLAGLTDYLYNLHLGQHVLSEIILRHLLRLPHAQVRWNRRVTAVEQDATGVTITLAAGSATERLRGAWLIGADGARSGVRRALAIPFAGHTWPERFVATNVYFDFERYGFARANFVVDPEDWAIVPILSPDGMWRVTYQEDAALSEDEVLRRIPARYRVLLPGPEPYELVAAASYRVHERAAARFRKGRVLLAGDAAHVCNPTGGYGLTGGLLDAVALAEVLAAVVHGDADEGVLDVYAQERRRVFLEVSSPGASENKRRLAERDPARQRRDAEHFRRLNEDPAYEREALAYSFKLAGNPMPVPARF